MFRRFRYFCCNAAEVIDLSSSCQETMLEDEPSVNSRLQTCGQGYKGLRCLYELDPNKIGDEAAKRYCKRVVNFDPLTVCKIRQPKNRQNAGGVGNIYVSRRDNCNKKCG